MNLKQNEAVVVDDLHYHQIYLPDVCLFFLRWRVQEYSEIVVKSTFYEMLDLYGGGRGNNAKRLSIAFVFQRLG